MKSNRKPFGAFALDEAGSTAQDAMAYDKRLKRRAAQKRRSKQARKAQYRLAKRGQ